MIQLLFFLAQSFCSFLIRREKYGRPSPPKIQGCQIDQQIQSWSKGQLQDRIANNSVALREMAQRNVEWYSVHTNGVALREMAQRNVEWYSVHTNSVALREMA